MPIGSWPQNKRRDNGSILETKANTIQLAEEQCQMIRKSSTVLIVTPVVCPIRWQMDRSWITIQIRDVNRRSYTVLGTALSGHIVLLIWQLVRSVSGRWIYYLLNSGARVQSDDKASCQSIHPSNRRRPNQWTVVVRDTVCAMQLSINVHREVNDISASYSIFGVLHCSLAAARNCCCMSPSEYISPANCCSWSSGGQKWIPTPNLMHSEGLWEFKEPFDG